MNHEATPITRHAPAGAVADARLPVLVLTGPEWDDDGDTVACGPVARPTLRQRVRARRHARAARPVQAPRGLLLCILAVFALGFGLLALTGKPVRLPVWLVAEAEARLNASVARALGAGPAGDAVVSIGGAVLFVDRADWRPKVVVEDLRVLRAGGETLLALPEVQVTFDAGAAFSGRARLQSLRLVGGQMTVRRLEDGSFDLSLGGGMPPLTFDSAAALLRAFDAVFKRPSLAALSRIEAEALSLRVEDARAGRTWDLGDGRLTLEPRADGVAAEIGVSLVGGAETPARARLTLVTDRAVQRARMAVAVERVTSGDIAVQAAGLGWLGLIDAEVSGDFAAELALDPGAPGLAGGVEASLTLGAGALRPAAGGAPVEFDRAAVAFGFDPVRERLDLRDLTVEGRTLRLSAAGYADLPGVMQGVPETAIVQVGVREMRIDPEGLFATPAVFDGGGIDLRVRRDPFTVEIGQATLRDGPRRMTATGRVAALAKGWDVALDVALDEIGNTRLVQLWPLRLVPKTRTWLAENVQQGQLFNVRAGLRAPPGAEPRLQVSYEFADADVAFLKGLPPIRDGRGYAVLEGTRYTLVLDAGRLVPPLGGALDVAGSVLAVPDVTVRPSPAEITFRSRGSLTATLSLMDEPPFRYMTKAGQPVDLGEGVATVAARVNTVLGPRVPGARVDWAMTGKVAGFRSDRIVPGRVVAAELLEVTGRPGELVVRGPGTLDGVAFDAVFTQPLGAGAGPGVVTGRFDLSANSARALKLGLPDGALSGGATPAQVTVTLPRGAPPRLRMTTDLRGLGLSLPEVGWTKPRPTHGSLTVEARLGARSEVTALSLTAPGLDARGTMTLRPGGGLDRLRLSRLRVGDWLDAAAVLTGQGAATPTVALTGGRLDVRRLPAGGAGGGRGGGAISLALDRVVLSDGIALTDVQARLTTRGGLSGGFSGRVNGGPAVDGTISPGTVITVKGANAGGVLSAAGIFPNARGGTLDMTMAPRGGGYAGRVEMTDVRVRNTPVIAELINAISVVGLLDQLNGQGLFFNEAEAEFRLSSAGVEIRRGSAIGASLGVTLAGLYEFGRGRLDMRGVISPIYLLNGIGSVLTRRGEGLFGINYRLTGAPSDPQVSVNPLSILTPGMFRELFRRPPPRIGDGIGGGG